MTKLTHTPPEINNMAEGSPDPHETREPVNPLKTTQVPQVQGTAIPSALTGETGVVGAVDLTPEGEDDQDVQDASRTTAETKATPMEEAAQMSPKSKKPTVLIIEDTVELAEVMQATLEGMGLDATHETHGLKGLEKLKSMNPDVLLLDIGLPDMIGWKILDHLKEEAGEGNEARLPIIIVITAYGDPANRLVAKLQDIHSYLIKPITPDEVERVVGRALSGAGQ